MRKIRTFALAVALALSAFYLVPAAVSAADKAVDIKGKASASGRLELATGFVTEAGSGTLSHFGEVHLPPCRRRQVQLRKRNLQWLRLCDNRGCQR